MLVGDRSTDGGLGNSRGADNRAPVCVPSAAQLLSALSLTVWAADLEGRIVWPEPLRGGAVLDTVSDAGSRDQLQRAMRLLRDGESRHVQWESPGVEGVEGADGRVFLMQVTPLASAGAEGTAPGAMVGFVFSSTDITLTHRSRETVINTGIALSEAIALDRVYDEVATQLRRAIPSSGLVIALADDDTARFRIAHRQGFEGEQGATAVLEQQLPRLWLDALAKNQVVLDPTSEGLVLTAPLISPEGVLGAITIRASEPLDGNLLDDAARVLAAVAAQTAVAIERAWLVERVESKRRLEAIGEVAAGVAHELRNPLFGISSAAQLLLLRAREPGVVERGVGRILREVERLNRMVSELLDFGRPNVAHLVAGDPDAVWDDILEGERARVDGKGLVLHRVRAHGARCAIDAAQLGQVFRNVLVNACDAAPQGGELSLHSTFSPVGAWRARLTNSGNAIPPDVLPHVFEFFYSTKSGGTGIGLALCQRIMDEHSGTISIESSAEAGTTVTVTLPPSITA